MELDSLDNLDFVTKLIDKMEEEQRNSDVIPASYLDLDPVQAEYDTQSDDDEYATAGYEELEELEDIQQEHSNSTVQRIPPANEWCSCGMCITQPTLAECYCCNESEIVASLRKEYDCVTQVQQFVNLCEDEEALKYNRYLYAQQISDSNKRKEYLLKPLDPSLLRHIAYKNFVNLVNCNQLMGRWNRVALPSCVVRRVRQLFPDPNNHYKGFTVSDNGTEQSYQEM